MTDNIYFDKDCNVEQYLKRIGYTDSPDTTSETLGALQEAHIHTVPYENIDILLERRLSLEIPQLYEKIVINGRGGYCFELNGLFGWLLRQLSFQVTDHFARFLRDETTIPKRRHRVLKVEAEDGIYLCDAGIGGIAPRRPLKLTEGIVQKQGDETYRLAKDSFLGWVVQELHNGEWRNLYSFTEEPQLPVDFTAINYFCENSPDSIFKAQAMVFIRTADGRKTIAGRELRIFSPKGVEITVLDTGRAFYSALKKHFGIVIV